MRIVSIEKIKLNKPTRVYDIGVRDSKHEYALSNGVVSGNSWSHPADALRYMVVSCYHRVKPKGMAEKGRTTSLPKNVVDGLAF